MANYDTDVLKLSQDIRSRYDAIVSSYASTKNEVDQLQESVTGLRHKRRELKAQYKKLEKVIVSWEEKLAKQVESVNKLEKQVDDIGAIASLQL